MLGRYVGKVVHGQGLGRQFGLPTANLDVDCSQLKQGVYGGIALAKGKDYPCVVNVGLRPSVDSSDRLTFEVHLFGFEGDLYDQTVEADLLYYLRPTQTFASMEEVVQQVNKDIAQTLSLLMQQPNMDFSDLGFTEEDLYK